MDPYLILGIACMWLAAACILAMLFHMLGIFHDEESR
jgi:uncharacterized membrane protein